MKTISEELKQREVAMTAKIKRFKQPCDRYKKGKLFKSAKDSSTEISPALDHLPANLLLHKNQKKSSLNFGMGFVGLSV